MHTCTRSVRCTVLLTEPCPRAGTLSGPEPNELEVFGVCRLHPVLLIFRSHTQQLHVPRLAVGLSLREALFI